MNRKKYFFILIILIIIASKSYSQNRIKLFISEKETNIPFAHITLKKDSISQVSYYFSDINGYIEINLENNFNKKIVLTITALGYNEEKVFLDIDINQKTSKTVNILLVEKIENLNEVIIRTTKPLIEKKDTIVFRTKFFAKGNEQTIEDLLKNIPGLQIDENGTISIGNQEIEKLMIDGDDLFEKGYKILSKNMPAYPIEEVEILKNYSNNRLLKGIEESNKVALNLKLNEKSKRIWFGNIETGIGNNSFYKFKTNLMNFGKKNKYYFLTNFNNIGVDATGDIENLIRPFRMNEPNSVGDNENVNVLLNLSPSKLNFKQTRTNFNKAKLASINAIFNPSEKLKIKTLGFFNWDETNFFRNSTDFINLANTSFINTEDYKLRNKKRIAFGKIDFIYNISKNKMLEATTKYNDGNFNDSSNLIFNTNASLENLNHQNKLFDQIISYTNKFTDKKVLLLIGRFINEKSPETYRINNFFYQNLFQNFDNANNVSQQNKNKMQFIAVNAHLLDRKKEGNLFEFQIGNELRKDNLSSVLSLLENETVLENPDGYKNQTKYQVNDLYLKSKLLFKIKDFSIVGKFDIHQLFNSLENNRIKSIQQPFFINPSIGFNWDINNQNRIVSSYSYSTTNAKSLDVFSDFVLTGFRSFSRGTGSFNQLNASSLYFNYQLGNWSERFFANTFILLSKNHDFFSTNSFIQQNFVQSEKILIKDRAFISINSNLDYYFELISSNLKLDLGYIKSEFKNIVNSNSLRRVSSNNYNYGLEIRSGFRGIFNYHIGTKWLTTEIKTTIKNSFTNNTSFLDVSFIFNKKFDLQLQSERYFFGNLENENTYYFLDFDMSYKLIHNKLVLTLSGKNLFNVKKFKNFSISDISSSTTEYRLMPRFILIKMECRF